MKATVYVRLKQEVLDPQGDAVKRALGTLGFAGVDGRARRQAHRDRARRRRRGDAPTSSRSKLHKMADEMLANTVIEDYEVAVSR